jgi:hypothetical protein
MSSYSLSPTMLSLFETFLELVFWDSVHAIITLFFWMSPIQWLPAALSLGVKWLGREADHSPPSSAEVKE